MERFDNSRFIGEDDAPMPSVKIFDHVEVMESTWRDFIIVSSTRGLSMQEALDAALIEWMASHHA